MNKHRFDFLDDKLERIIKEAKRIVKSKENFSGCTPKCISCLVAHARGNDDNKQYGFGFSSSDDPAMIEAKYELLKLKEFKNWENN